MAEISEDAIIHVFGSFASQGLHVHAIQYICCYRYINAMPSIQPLLNVGTTEVELDAPNINLICVYNMTATTL